MKKHKKKFENKEFFINRDDDLAKKGTVDHNVEPPWPVLPKRKSDVTKNKTGNEQ